MKADTGRIASISRGWPPGLRMVLLFGPDESASRDLAGQLLAGLGASTVNELDGSTLKHDPQALVAAATSMSMFGDSEVVRLDRLDEAGLPAVEALLAGPTGHPVVALAGDLKAASKLRQYAEKQAEIAACLQYEVTARDAPKLLAEMAAPLGLRLERGVAEAVFEAAAGDRGVIRREIEKYALFKDSAPDAPQRLTLEDVAAIGLANGEAELFAPIGAITTGDLETATDLLARLPDGTAIPLLRGVERRLAQLISLRVEVDAGRSPTDVVDGKGRAIFFREKPAISTALSLWSQERLHRAMADVLAAERAVKTAGGLADLGVHASLLTITRRAAAAKRR